VASRDELLAILRAVSYTYMVISDHIPYAATFPVISNTNRDQLFANTGREMANVI